jgi:hypothetical protein
MWANAQVGAIKQEKGCHGYDEEISDSYNVKGRKSFQRSSAQEGKGKERSLKERRDYLNFQHHDID